MMSSWHGLLLLFLSYAASQYAGCVQCIPVAVTYDICEHSELTMTRDGSQIFVTSPNYPHWVPLYSTRTCRLKVNIAGCSRCKLRITVDVILPRCSSHHPYGIPCHRGCNGLTFKDYDANTTSTRYFYGRQSNVTMTSSSPTVDAIFCRSVQRHHMRFRVRFVVKEGPVLNTDKSVIRRGNHIEKIVPSVFLLVVAIGIIVFLRCDNRLRCGHPQQRQRQRTAVQNRAITDNRDMLAPSHRPAVVNSGLSRDNTEPETDRDNSLPPSYEECIRTNPSKAASKPSQEICELPPYSASAYYIPGTRFAPIVYPPPDEPST